MSWPSARCRPPAPVASRSRATLSVVGWDDTLEASRAAPPLTTIRQSLRDQGRRCAELAASGDAVAAVEPQPWELVVRESTASFSPPGVNTRMGRPASADIELGARVAATQPLPEGVAAGACGTVVGEAGWIQRRWRVRFDDGPCIDVPVYASTAAPATAASAAQRQPKRS